jgi:hypothetical protein
MELVLDEPMAIDSESMWAASDTSDAAPAVSKFAVSPRQRVT